MTQEDKKLLWHSLDENPIFPSSDNEPLCSILVLYDNGNMFLYRYTKYGIPNDIGTPHFRDIINAKWCYCNDLIPLLMTQEKKQLLLKDLCARLPYGVMYETEYGPRIINDLFIYSNGPVYTDHNVGDYNEVYGIELGHIKPYLRPMSSMTEEEINEYENFITNEKDDQIRFCNELVFYNSHHFDYRGLIQKGLALEAPEDMYKTK